MKTMGLILIVIALHCAVLGSVFFISGCGTTSKTEPPTSTPVMPPPQPPKPESIAVPPAMPESVAAKETKFAGGGEYIVQAGDSLAVIAKRCHVTKAELIEANKLADPNKLKVGQKLILPASGQLPPAAALKSGHKAKEKSEAAKSAAPEHIQAGANEYVVKAGDNLSKIAAQCGVKVSALREANKLQSDKLKVGQKLAIPEAKKAVAPEAAPAAGAAAAVAPKVIEPAPSAPATPVKGAEVAPAAGASTNAAPISSSGIIHVVQPNEDLSSIAKLYAVTVEEIAELNQLSTNRTVQVGQRLKIP